MQNILKIAALVSFLAYHPRHAGAQIPVEQLTIEGVKRYVAEQGIHSIEALMDELPPVLKDTFALIEDSHSRQRPATTREPRIVMFLPDGKFFLSVATHPRSNAYDQVEMLEFTADARWRMDLIPFPSGRGDYLPTLAAVEQCTSCHGENRRPIWGNYDGWYGSFADNAGQYLTDRQARKLTEALGPNGVVRIRKLTFNGHLQWHDRETFDLPAYHDNAGGPLMNDGIIVRQTEHLWARAIAAPNYELLLVAYLFLDDASFLEQVPDDVLALVHAVKRRLRDRVDQLYQESGAQYAGDYSDRALRLLGFDPYADLFVSRSMNDLNLAYRDQELYIDRNFGTGGDDLNAWILLRIVNWIIANNPGIEGHFENTPYVGDGAFATVNEYRKRLSWWAWEATLEERVQLLRTQRHLSALLRTRFLLPVALQQRAAHDLVDIANTILDQTRPAR